MTARPSDKSREHRHPASGGIDQRAQQIDPAGHHRLDLNASAKGTMKQPGRVEARDEDRSGTMTTIAPSARRELRTGRTMPLIGLGTWGMGEDVARVVDDALRADYAMIDTARDYGSQPGIGDALRGAAARRDQVYVVTKIEEADNPREAVENDLKVLRLDHADLTLIHRPPPNGVGERLWEGLAAIRDEGLVRDIGVSNYSVAQIDKLIEATGEVPAVNQIEWSPFGHSSALQAHHQTLGILIMAYSPLTRGQRLNDPVLRDIAATKNRSPAQVLLRWNLQRGTVPIPKSSSADHVVENFALFDFFLSGDDMERLDELNEGWSALGGLSYA
ncbi:aldo/keto reductase [Salipiger sp. PrR007]|uniref:aldo/keto reductase n=1 Tax=Salipiger sp. PrR007 TaxID=2706884 RepID=UPI00194122FC|nr:aldo/keto reductase [Salipiger sp. PrR007]